ncbi:MAG: glycosyltransferase family 39 protein [Anaerolineales bacterium]|nr:glycosyltransferase family 39 protein [Anaerolineales bacterium]
MKIKKEKKKLNRGEWITLFLGTTFFFGAIARFFPGIQAGFPLNDGGMFLSMIRDLRDSQYVLPAVTSYNNLNIPYAYPPFGFYFTRLLSDVFSLSEIMLLRWIPPTVNSLSILAFYALSSLLLESRRRAAVAAIFYALTPGASAWFIMGGGVTRSLGSLFMLLSLWWVYRLFREGGKLALALSILFCSLTVLSHPEVGIHTAASCILLWLDITIFQSGCAAFCTICKPDSRTDSPCGACDWHFWGIWKQKYFLLLWCVIPYLVEPRRRRVLLSIPFAC